MDVYYEYNLINNIPIIHPELDIKLHFLPRQELVTPDIVLKIFDKKYDIIKIKDRDFKYVKVDINKKYKTLNNEVECLYCYIIYDYKAIYDNIYYNIYDNIIEKYINNENNYFLITNPILKYKDKLYTINVNNNDIDIIYFDNNINDNIIINRLINNKLYTVCDNKILLISLYRKNIISKDNFKILIILNKNEKINRYVDKIWIYFLYNRKMMSICDYSYLYLSKSPSLIDKNIYKIFIEYNLTNIYIQYNYKNNLLFTSSITNSYPNTTKNFIKNNVYYIDCNMWINNANYINDYINDNNSLYIPDYYGLYTSIISNNSFWNYWVKNKRDIIKGILYNLKNNKLLYLTDSLISLFKLYNIGYDGKYIRKGRVRELWLNILHIVDYNHKYINKIFEMYILNNKNYKKDMPYIFLLDIYDGLDICKNKPYIYINNYNTSIYKITSLYNILKTSNDIILHNFYKNNILNRKKYILTYIYKKFNMFDSHNEENYEDDINNDIKERYHIIGKCIINYLENNINYII
jgi:hypothetical protein